MRFLLTRRWAVFAVVVVALAWLAVLLGQWQFHRLEDRKHDNRVVATNLAAAPQPVDEVMSPDRAPARDDEWLRVTVHGTWDDQNTIVLKYQTRDRGAGVDVITPLVTSSGAAVLVDRGWVSTDNTGKRPDLPAADAGEVTVTGWVRRDATGGATKVSELSTRAVSSRAMAGVLPYPVYRGFLDLHLQSPAPAEALEPVELPDDTSNGPHFFYGLQWWFFGALAVFGFGYLAWDEWRLRRARPASQGAQHPPVDRQHHAADKA